MDGYGSTSRAVTWRAAASASVVAARGRCRGPTQPTGRPAPRDRHRRPPPRRSFPRSGPMPRLPGPGTTASRSAANRRQLVPGRGRDVVALRDQQRRRRRSRRSRPGPARARTGRPGAQPARRRRGRSGPAARRSPCEASASQVDVAGHRCGPAPAHDVLGRKRYQHLRSRRWRIGIATARPSVCVRASPSSRRSNAPGDCQLAAVKASAARQISRKTPGRARCAADIRRPVGRQVGTAREIDGRTARAALAASRSSGAASFP